MKSELILLPIAILTVGLIVALAISFSLTNPAVGSVSFGSEYLSTTTIQAHANTHWLAKGISGGGTCTFGSITVASSSRGTLTVWNATSTTDTASTTITTLVAAIGEGTYTYDLTCSRGLVVETPSDFNGMYTITYR